MFPYSRSSRYDLSIYDSISSKFITRGEFLKILQMRKVRTESSWRFSDIFTAAKQELKISMSVWERERERESRTLGAWCIFLKPWMRMICSRNKKRRRFQIDFVECLRNSKMETRIEKLSFVCDRRVKPDWVDSWWGGAIGESEGNGCSHRGEACRSSRVASSLSWRGSSGAPSSSTSILPPLKLNLRRRRNGKHQLYNTAHASRDEFVNSVCYGILSSHYRCILPCSS